MFNTIRFCGFFLMVTTINNPCFGGLILSVDGALFTTVSPDPGSSFTVDDGITGTITFSSIGDSAATAFTLSTTLGGLTGFTFDVPDVSSPPSGITVNTNSFEWSGSVLTSWDLLVFGNLVGSTQDEQISISSSFGDQADLDLTGASGSSALTFQSASFQIVPEPSSFACFLMLSAGALLGLRKRKRGH